MSTNERNLVPAKSPLMEWWAHHTDDINDACLASTGSVANAIGLRRELDVAARGELDIDDHRLQLVVGFLCSDTEDAYQVIAEHRKWQQAKGER
ncbi:MAG: hypothetical protein AAF711_04955 [Planctomycetota bacterium]